MGTRHRRHGTERKLRLVRMYLNGEASLHGLAREHEISRNLIRLWVVKFEKGELSEELEQSAKIPEYEAKIAALERKIGQFGAAGTKNGVLRPYYVCSKRFNYHECEKEFVRAERLEQAIVEDV